MRFCDNCENMYYIQIRSEDSDELMYYCRKCGDTSEMTVDETLSITSSELNKDKSNFDDIINKYTKYDPTLPKVNYIKCPNTECSSYKDDSSDSVKNDILYIRYDENKMKYIYMCTVCDMAWKSDISSN